MLFFLLGWKIGAAAFVVLCFLAYFGWSTILSDRSVLHALEAPSEASDL